VNTPVNVLILAAGLGTRMKSEQAKVLHKLGSRTLIANVLRTAAALNPENIIVVVGHQADKVEAAARSAFSANGADSKMAERLQFVTQDKQLGTGHAVKSATEVIKQLRGLLVVFYGDTPAVKARRCKS
jgi:bifunctional UDP-N-acetylglucosamine pyrophosphorylase/glucosamine-1-phosphate N-acetyltransferase